MKRIAMNGVGGPEILHSEEAEAPQAGPGEVLIEVHAAGVNRPDIAQRKGLYPAPPGASPILGLEVAGKIAAVGEGVKRSIGESVCALVPGGGYAEFCVAPESHCLPLPKGLSFEEAAGIPETFFTVWANVFQIGELSEGKRFLVHGGSSGIGTTAIQLGLAFGAEVYATAGSAEKCALCVKLGAKHAINYKERAFETEILSFTEGKGVDLILDMVGGPYTDKNIACLAQRGSIVQIATQLGASVTINLAKLMQKRGRLTGSTMRPRSIADKAAIASELKARVWPLLESGEVKVLVNRVFPLAEAKEAHAFLESGDNTGKVILRVR